jgi:hypothetical protein
MSDPADKWDYGFGGCAVGVLIGVIFLALLVYVGLGVIEPRRYCVEGFGQTELVLREDGTWECVAP